MKARERLAFLPITRRKFIRVAATACGVAAPRPSVNPRCWSRTRPRIVRLEIALRRWPARLEGFTVALLSDFHYDPHFSVHPLRSAIGLVNGLRPELIVLAGDFVSVPLFGDPAPGSVPAAEPCSQLFAAKCRRLTVYGQ